MRIFVNNVDGYLAGAICADLRKVSHNIIGTRKARVDELVPPSVKRIVPRIELRRMLKQIASCDVVIYDLHDADLEELELILRMFHISEFSHELVFILISSVGVWARTQREYEEVPQPPATPMAEEEEAEAGDESEVVPPAPPLRAKTLCSDAYIRRLPAPKFLEWKTIETLVLALKDKLTIVPYVICAGIPYGLGEEPFLGLFQAAWQGRDTLRVIGDGRNSIPLIHARDVARAVRTILQKRPPLDYHLVVDKGDLTQRQLIEAVAREFGIWEEIPSVTVYEAILAELADILTMDLRLEASSILTEGDEGDDVPEGEPAVRGMRWWCQSGLADNIATVASEFRRWRRLDPIRFCIIGPPGCCAERLSTQLAERYNLPLANFPVLLDDLRNQESSLGEQLKAKRAEITAALSNPKAPGPFFEPASLTTQVPGAVVDTAVANYRGFVLSGFPCTVEEATDWFLEDAPEPPPPPEDGSTPPVVEPQKVVRAAAALDVVALVSSPDDVCSARMKEERPIPDNEFAKLMDRWKKESADGPNGLAEFFRERCGIEPLLLNEAEASEEEMLNQIADCLENKRAVYNFLPPPPRLGKKNEEDAAPREEVPARDEEAARREAEERRRRKEKEERAEQIRREELIRLEKHSEPLRQYLMSLVVPTLAKGMVEVCREQPEDPTGYLAEYLAVYARASKARATAKRRAKAEASSSKGLSEAAGGS